MLNNVFAHWKTTLSGIALAVATVVLNGRTPHAFGMAVAIAVFGAAVKDPGSK
jgi:hypothetical protein